jgi:hypothetical protein
MSVTAASARARRGLNARLWGGVVAVGADDYARRTPRFLPHLHATPPPLAGSR